MNDKDYQAAAQVTLSHQFFGEFVSTQKVQSVLTQAINALNELDVIKKVLFYGRGVDNLPMITPERAIGSLPTTGQEETIIHALIGSATEAGEKLEALYEFLVMMQQYKFLLRPERPEFDVVNLVEESGDSFWYEAVFAEAVGTSLEHIKQTNINKLKKRYQSKFDAFEANNRDLEAEREILEKRPSMDEFSAMIQPVKLPEDLLSQADLAVRHNTVIFSPQSTHATYPDGSTATRIMGESEEAFELRCFRKFAGYEPVPKKD